MERTLLDGLKILTLTSEVNDGWKAFIANVTVLLTETPFTRASKVSGRATVLLVAVQTNEPLPLATVLMVPGRRIVSAVLLNCCLRVALVISSGVSLFELVHA